MDVGIELAAGDVLLDRYRVDAKIGEGGMGGVYLGWHVALEMAVAIKVIRLPAGGDAGDQARVRLLREARGLARLRSEFVRRPLDYGALPTGAPFLVLEYLEGMSLAERAARGLLPRAEAVTYVAQAAAGLAEAHAHHVVHRDVKPSNVFLARAQGDERIAKVLDFGIAKTLSLDTDITRGGQLLGTPEYMSPEQVRDAPSVDERTDVWSLGVVLYRLLGGALPFRGATKPRTLASILDDEPPALRTLRPDLPLPLQRVVEACLAKDPDRRIESAAELAARLAPFGTDEAKRAARVALATESSASTAVTVRRATPWIDDAAARSTPTIDQNAGPGSTDGAESEARKAESGGAAPAMTLDAGGPGRRDAGEFVAARRNAG
ncbi:MAG: serine/threonine-protein kinase [Polyangiaceae bacterium]